jgi:GT2 family glycosyltransferase
MLEKLPILLGFQPKFYTGGPSRFHLALLHDLVVSQKPKSIVTLGFGDGQACFTFCQAAREQDIDCRCAAVRREHAGEKETDDLAWLKGKDYGQEFYGDLIRFFDGSTAEAAKEFADASVDLLLLDDCDAGAAIRSDLSIWESKLSPNGLILVHGTALERADNPKAAWLKWSGARPAVEFPDGIGLGITSLAKPRRAPEFLKQLFEGKKGPEELVVAYRLAATRIEAQARLDEAVRAQAALEARQVWLDSLLADRWKVQEIMDHQARAIADLEQRFEALLADRTKAQEIMDSQLKDLEALRSDAQLVRETQAEQLQNFEALRRDRAKAQLVMDSQHEQLNHSAAETENQKAAMEQLKDQIKDQKRILSAAKKACRKNGRCFHIPTDPKVHRPLSEKIVREIRRLPRNLGIFRAPKSAPPPEKPPVVAPIEPPSRYAAWISEHEPNMAALEEQRRASSQLEGRPKISLLVPVYNTRANFLAGMFASVSAQTYDNWELCVVDGGSDQPETLAALQYWVLREPRICLEALKTNLGIAENTNRALQLATGDFIACADHDDLLAPFALFELARAIGDFPEADIFYSDEDRWSEGGERHAPFFKPEWSPELLCAFMYIGHLTAYRRSLIDQIGGFRKEFDLSQDYDFALRATERARAIHHIPHVLYHWREHPASGSLGGKPDARKSNLAALGDAMRRRNLPAEIIEYPTANRARLKVSSWPRVSVIVPTDSPTRAQICLRDLPRNTKYPDLEIVIVTKSKLVESLKSLEAENATVRLVPYDKPFNFSDKCNLGAEASTGERLIFFNDDVEPAQPDWIQNVIEPLENPEVGAVSPKLLYETGKIQHAGLVMGVRGLAGTAFHQRVADSTEHFNMAQSLRDVAALSAACLAVRRDDFMRLGGFDAVNTPIAHSDIDLCFKIREAGLRCVYTPYATLNHAGHVSIAIEEKREAARRRDKVSIYLLKRWARYTSHDPYFTDNMRDWLYSDSPTPIRMMARDQPGAVGSSPDLLFVSHDLSLSGAPMMLFHAVRWCRDNGIFVLVMAPKDGPLGEKLKAEGIPLIIDPLIETGHESFVRFARDFDCIVANTIRSGAVVRAMQKENVPIAWWLHEPGSVGEHYIREDAKLRAALPLADVLFAPSERTAAVYRPFTDRPVKCLRNAIPDLHSNRNGKGDASTRPLRFLLLGSIEPRKGQDVFVEALALLPREMQEAAQFQIAGRILDPDFWPKVEAAATTLKNFSARGALDHTEAIELMTGADVIVSASRDEAMPTVTILEAMCLGKALIATTVGGAREVLVEGENSLLVRPEAPDALAAAIRRFIEDPALVSELGAKARETYERNFTMERFGKEFRELIDEVISVPTSGSRERSN